MKFARKRVNYTCASFALTLALLFVAACSGPFKTTGSKPISLPGGGKAVANQTGPSTPEPLNPGSGDQNPNQQATPTVYLTTNFAEGRQRKNVDQLKDAVLNCVGGDGQTNILNVSEDMLSIDLTDERNQNKFTQHHEGRERFLLPNIYGAYINQSVLKTEEQYLQTATTRTGLTSDDIEDEIYLKSLVIVASVVAYNCDVKNPASNCYCATKASAEKMVLRCLPQFSPSTVEFKAAVEELHSPDNCGAEVSTKEGFIKRRRAVAALLSSYAFATAK